MPALAIFCLAPSRGRADRIIHELKGAEFAHTDLGVLFFDRSADEDRARERDSRVLTVAAAQSAGPIRGGLAWIAGIGRLAIPGVGAFIAAGPIIAAIHQARNSVPGAAIARGLLNLGVPAAAAASFEQRIKVEGHILISVHTVELERIHQARDIFAEANAQDICTTADVETSAPSVPAG